MLTYQDLATHTYRNTRPVLANLDVTDLVRASVLAKLDLALMGNTGSGKTQLAKGDIFNGWFNGNKKEGGNGIFLRAHPEIDIYHEIFTELNLERAQRELTTDIEALVYLVDELNRAPPVSQNQFLGLGDGVMDHKGRAIKLGRRGYHLLIATANLGNGEFQGTFDIDKALYNRLHVILDMDHPDFKPTREDKFELRGRRADPNVKEAPKKDLSELIIDASEAIGLKTVEPGLETIAVAHFLEFGLDHCLNSGKTELTGPKGKVWPINCQDCPFNTDGKAVCSKIKAPVERTIEATIRYAAALEYLAQLKDQDQRISATDLMFKSFELTGAYQFLLNPGTLRQEYVNENPRFMSEVVRQLKDEFNKRKDFVITSMEQAQRGKRMTRFFWAKNGKGEDAFSNYDGLSELAKAKIQPVEPFTDAEQLGFAWVNDYINFLIKNRT